METQTFESKGVDFCHHARSIKEKFAELLFWKHNPELTHTKLKWDSDGNEYVFGSFRFKDKESKLNFYQNVGFEVCESDEDYEQWESDVKDELISAQDITPPTFFGSTDEFCSLFCQDQIKLTRPQNLEEEISKLEKLFDLLIPFMESSK